MIRLAKIGKKKYRTFRVVVSEKSRDVFGPANEILGYYDPHKNELKVNAERVQHWISVGAKPSPTLHNLFVSQNIIKGKKVAFVRAKKKKQEEGTPEAKAAEPTKEAKEEPKPAVPKEKKEEPKAVKAETPKTEEPVDKQKARAA